MMKLKEFKLTNFLAPDVGSCMCVSCHKVQNYGSVRNVERGSRIEESRARSEERGARSEERGVRRSIN